MRPDDVIGEAASFDCPFDFGLAPRGERFLPLFSIFGQRLHFEPLTVPSQRDLPISAVEGAFHRV